MNKLLDKVDNSVLSTADSSSLGTSVAVALVRENRAEVTEELPSVEYLRTEFPSECWYFPNVTSNVDHLLEHFIKMLPKDSRIEHVYWEPEDDVLKICTIIPEPNFELEGPIYDAQLAFMDAFPKYECDFVVIYRFGKALNDIEPKGARRVF